MRSRLPSVLVAAALALAGCEPTSGGSPPAAAADSTPPVQPADSVAANRPVVVFLGTSLTAGLGLRDPDRRFPEVLGRVADSAGLPIQVVNAGVSGETSAGGVRRLDFLLDRPMDVLVVELGANDGLRGQDPGALEANLRTIVQTARQRHPGVHVILLGMEAPPNLGPDYTTRFREVFPRVAGSEGTALVPFLLQDVGGIPELNQPDGIHPTAEGHLILAHNVWPVLDSILVAMEKRP